MMNAATLLRLVLILSLALCLADQLHHRVGQSPPSPGGEAGQTSKGGNLESHDFIDFQHIDDIVQENQVTLITPEAGCRKSYHQPVAEPIPTSLPPAWQPPESRS